MKNTQPAWADRHPVAFSAFAAGVVLAVVLFLAWRHPTVLAPRDLVSLTALAGLPVVHAARTARRARALGREINREECAREMIRGTQTASAFVLVAVVVCVGVLLRVLSSGH